MMNARDPRVAVFEGQHQKHSKLPQAAVNGTVAPMLQPAPSPQPPVDNSAATELAACCLQTVAPMALGAQLLGDLLCLEAALLGSPQAQGLSLLQGALVRCKRQGRYSWQQIVGTVPQEGGAPWALLVGQEGNASAIPSQFVSPHPVNPDQAGVQAELAELATRWPSMLSSRQQVAEVHWALEGGSSLLSKILERKQLPRGSGRVPVSSSALAALVATLRMPDGPASRLLFVPPAGTTATPGAAMAAVAPEGWVAPPGGMAPKAAPAAAATAEATVPAVALAVWPQPGDLMLPVTGGWGTSYALPAATVPATQHASQAVLAGQQGPFPPLPPGFDVQGAAAAAAPQGQQQQQQQHRQQLLEEEREQQGQEGQEPLSIPLLPPGFGVQRAVAVPDTAPQQSEHKGLEAGTLMPPGFESQLSRRAAQPMGTGASSQHTLLSGGPAASPATIRTKEGSLLAVADPAGSVQRPLILTSLPAAAASGESAGAGAVHTAGAAAAAGAAPMLGVAVELAAQAQALGSLTALDSAAAPELLLGIKRDLERLLDAAGLASAVEAGGKQHRVSSARGAAAPRPEPSGSGTDGVWPPPQVPAAAAAQVEHRPPAAAPAAPLRRPQQQAEGSSTGRAQGEQQAQQAVQGVKAGQHCEQAQQAVQQAQIEEHCGSEEGELPAEELGLSSASPAAKKQRREDPGPPAPAPPEGLPTCPATSQAAAGEGQARGCRRKTHSRRGKEGRRAFVLGDSGSSSPSCSVSSGSGPSRSCSNSRSRSRSRCREGRLPIDALPPPIRRAVLELCERNRAVLPISSFNQRVVMRMQDLFGARVSLVLGFLEGLEAELPPEPLLNPAPWVMSKLRMDRVRGQFAQLPETRGGKPMRHLDSHVRRAVRSLCESSYGNLPVSAFDLEVVGRMRELGGVSEQLRFVQYLDDQLRPGVLHNPSAWVMNRLKTVLGY